MSPGMVIRLQKWRVRCGNTGDLLEVSSSGGNDLFVVRASAGRVLGRHFNTHFAKCIAELLRENRGCHSLSQSSSISVASDSEMHDRFFDKPDSDGVHAGSV